MRFSMILEMVDRLTAPAKRARDQIRGITRNAGSMSQRFRSMAREVRRGERSVESFERATRRMLTVRMGRYFQSVGSRVRRLTRDLSALVRRLRLVERAGGLAARGLRRMGGMALDALKWGGAAVTLLL
ncbi:MAG: hypothetical protein CL955_03170 [Erythrobacteraceae bacterium]|nr:hypothetical protein [Erythrobacteraceae bacterium]